MLKNSICLCMELWNTPTLKTYTAVEVKVKEELSFLYKLSPLAKHKEVVLFEILEVRGNVEHNPFELVTALTPVEQVNIETVLNVLEDI